MFTKFKLLVGLVAVTLVSAVTIGLSTFYFVNTAKEEVDIHNTVGETGEEKIKADNILENYDFGQEDLNESYTYIFFPSTLYNEFSADEIEDPENIFGYNEVVLDDFGDPVTINGEVQYKVENGRGVNFDGNKFTSSKSTDNTYNNYYDLLKDSLNDNSEYYLYDLSSGDYPDYPSDTSDKYIDSGGSSIISQGDIKRFFGIKNNDPYVLNNYDAYSYLTGLSTLTYNDGKHWSDNNNLWKHDANSDLNDTYIGLGFVSYNIYAYFYRPDVEHFSKSEEILTPIYDNPETNDVNESVYRSFSLPDKTSFVDYDFSIDLTADYDSREGKNEIQMYVDGMVSGEGLSSATNKNPDWEKNYDEQLQKRRQYRNDRFGFWTEFYDWSTSSDNPNNGLYKEGTGSRYLPIKITTNGNLTPDTLAEILPDLSASMYSKDVYSDYTANVWTYNIGNSRDYSTATGGFTSKDITNIFDIMQNPSNYADGDNVIRLYPVYSNGKVPISDTTPTRETGGRDALKAKFTYADSTDSSSNADSTDLSSKLITNKKLVYSSEEGTTDGGMTINYAILKNIYLEPYLYTELSFDGDYSRGVNPRWSGKWHSMYRVSGSDLNEFLNTYGEGLYTFYLVVGNSARTNQASDDLTDVEKKLTESDSFPSLYQKSLIPWKFDTYYNDEFNGKGAYSCIQNGHNDNKDTGVAENIRYNNRPVALFIEKVTNLRLVTDIPIKENEDGTPSKDQDWKGIDSSVQAGLLSAKNFLLADGVKTYNKDGETIINETEVTSPYVYFIQNADFRYVNNLYFQIRFSNQYIPNALRIVTDFDDYTDPDDPLSRDDSTGITNKNPNQYVSYKIGNTTFELASQSALGDLYIQNVSASGRDGTTREGFKLKDYYARGVYDIMLVANGNYTEGSEADGTAKTIRVYNMYISRHTNSFIKVFDKNPGTFTYSYGGITGEFVRHKKEGEDLAVGETTESYTTAKKIWQGRGYLGEMFTSSSEFGWTSSLLTSLQEHFKTTQATSNLYKLVDAVTNRAVAYYDTKQKVLFNSQDSTENNKSIDLFMILKNYVLYLEPVTTS